MKMSMLVSGVVLVLVLLVGPDAASPVHRGFDKNLNSAFDDADKYNNSLAQDYFVEDVSHLAEGKNKCEDKFFCKVHDILVNHFDKRKEEAHIVRNLKIYLDHQNANCTELMKNMTHTGIKKPIPFLLGCLKHCIRVRNLNSTGSSR